MVSGKAHNLEVGGSNPPSATKHMVLTDDLKSFLSEAKAGTAKSNKELLAEINNLNPDSESYQEDLTRLIVLLITKRPYVTPYFKINPATAWAKYMIANSINKRNSTMATFLKYIDKPVSKILFHLYEMDYKETRNFVHWVNSLEGNDKVPYLHVLMTHLGKHIFKHEASTQDDIKNMMSFPNIIEITKNLGKEVGGLKRIGGETTSKCSYYTWIKNNFEIDYPTISSAEVGFDIGGGFTTPHLSSIFRKQLISLDKTNPNDAIKLGITVVPPEDTTLEEYHERLKNQPWQDFDVFKNSLDDSYNSYFITSFGFISSTVTPPSGYPKISMLTTYMGIKLITDLIAKNKDVYFFLYGRPTTMIYQNKIISMKFSNKKLIKHAILDDKFSSNTDKITGVKKLIMRIR